MRSARRTAIVVTTGAIAALATAAIPASALAVGTPTSFEHGNNASGSGISYTGIFAGGAVGNAVIDVPGLGTITCSQAPISGNITDAGSGASALGNVATSDFKTSGSEVCPDSVSLADHVNFTSQGLPWPAIFNWLDDDIDGTPNGAVSLSNVSILAELSIGNCTYNSNHNNTAGSTKQLLADVYNPDNSPSDHLEIRFVNEPFTSTDLLCASFPATLTVTYQLTGAPGAGELSVRALLPPVCANQTLSTPFQTPLNGTFNCTGDVDTFELGGTAPAHGTVAPNGPNGFTYTPASGYSGPDSFQYSATGPGGPSNMATVNVTVGAAPATGGGGTQGQLGGATTTKCKKKKKKKRAAAAKKKKGCKKKKKKK